MRHIDRLCCKYGVKSIIDLEKLYRDEDQRLMREGKWDYKDTDLLNTRIMQSVKVVPRHELNDEEKWRLEQIIWFWYHHAVSCAIYRYNDRSKALMFVKRALLYQQRIPDHPNKITMLFYLLLKKRRTDAEQLAERIECEVEAKTARELIAEWKD